MFKKIVSGLAMAAILAVSFIACKQEVEPETKTLKDLILEAKDGDTIDLGSVKFTAEEKDSYTIKQKQLSLKNGNVKGATFIVEGADVVFQSLTDIYTVIVDEKIGDTDFTLKNCYRVEEIYLNGGGSKSVHIGSTEIGKLVANKKDLHIQLDDDGATKIEKAYVFKDCSLDSKNDDNSFESIVISEAVNSVKLDGKASIDKIISTAENASDIKITVNEAISIASADKTVKESIASNEENKAFNSKQETIKDATLTEEEKKEIEKVKEDAGIKDEPKPEKPADEQKPEDDKKPSDEQKPAEETKPAEEQKPAEETKPAEGTPTTPTTPTKPTTPNEPEQDDVIPIEMNLNELIKVRTLFRNAYINPDTGEYSYLTEILFSQGSSTKFTVGDKLHLTFTGTADKDIKKLGILFLDNSEAVNYWKMLSEIAYVENIKAGETFTLDTIVKWIGDPVEQTTIRLFYNNKDLDETATIICDGYEQKINVPDLDKVLYPVTLLANEYNRSVMLYDITDAFESFPSEEGAVEFKFSITSDIDIPEIQITFFDSSYWPVVSDIYLYDVKANVQVDVNETKVLSKIPQEYIKMMISIDDSTEDLTLDMGKEENAKKYCSGEWCNKKLYIRDQGFYDIPNGTLYFDDVQNKDKTYKAVITVKSVSKLDETEDMNAELSFDCYTIPVGENNFSEGKDLKTETLTVTNSPQTYEFTFKILSDCEKATLKFYGKNAIIEVGETKFEEVDE